MFSYQEQNISTLGIIMLLSSPTQAGFPAAIRYHGEETGLSESDQYSHRRRIDRPLPPHLDPLLYPFRFVPMTMDYYGLSV